MGIFKLKPEYWMETKPEVWRERMEQMLGMMTFIGITIGAMALISTPWLFIYSALLIIISVKGIKGKEKYEQLKGENNGLQGRTEKSE